MPRLTEQYVQRESVEYLKEYYKEKYNKRKIYAGQELWVKKKYGGGRADGLISFKNINDNIFIASLEAKSCKTLGNITFWYDDIKWTNHGFLLSFLVLILSLYFFWDYIWYIKWTLPFIISLISMYIFGYITSEFIQYKAVDVIRQVERYPANERWIALSIDSYNKLLSKYRKTLHKKCKRKNIGLIIVSHGSRVKIKIFPKYIKTKYREKDYLQYYAREKIIRDIL